ncbi:MAG: hypothetical protein WKF87_14345 [Chryseolinea sp.]
MRNTATAIILFLSITAYAQKTRTTELVAHKGITISQIVGEDTLFLMLGRNAKYNQLVDIISLKSGRKLGDISTLLEECLKMTAEPKGTSLEYEGNSISSFGGGQIALWGRGKDSSGYVYLNKQIIGKLTEGLK